MKLIFAQGNPDKQYETTRHNVGWLAIDALAKRLNASAWKLDKKHAAELATATVGDEKVILVKPHTYYNETGRSAQSLVQFYKIQPASDLLVLHDDLALPFGTIRTREKGRDAGNNGIKSLNAHLGSQYGRIRIGIWNDLQQRMGDADFVLASFSKAEQAHLQDTVLPATFPFIDDFLHGTLAPHSVSHPLA